MKKSLIVLAALAAAGTASAQSYVTLYGTLDVNAQMNKVGSGSWTKTMGQNGYGTSQISVKGAEDLGGGLQGIFLVENDFNTYEAGHGFTGGESYVGLAGGFGSVKLGVPNSPSLTTQAGRQPFGTKAGGGFGTVLGAKVVRNDKSIRYDSPSFGGFSLAADVGDSSASAGNVATATGGKVVDIGAFYAAGPLSAGLTQWKQGSAKTTTLQASYQFGPAKIMGGLNKDVGTGATLAGKGANIGVSYALTSNLALDANFAKLKTDVSGDTDPTIVAVGPKYMLSKRTTAYARYVEAKDTAAVKTKTVLVGVQHNF
jgi:predicted porin